MGKMQQKVNILCREQLVWVQSFPSLRLVALSKQKNYYTIYSLKEEKMDSCISQRVLARAKEQMTSEFEHKLLISFATTIIIE